ncbi:hypothetical protein JTE90_022091 [Oedothorax gibbosus]|uniref:BESS domain-containing protein n=1 Tax=Oedothorax gibbosus TaxID=931172 RepID=A0AAV6TYT5_9ARAC|nr:hypothetical protein JTE90_022091 [Oedothorax gibbosus]
MTTLTNFVKSFFLWLDKRKCTKDTIYLRSGISSEEEAFEFVRSFGETTGTNWENYHVRPHSPKYVFFKTWFCKPPQNKEVDSSSPCNKCSAKIEILLKKTSAKNDPFSNHNPSLCCVIRFAGKHNHKSVDDDSFQMIGLTAELKEKFFEYFHIGLSASEAKLQHEAIIQTATLENKTQKHGCNITSRQAQRLYNHWLNLKDSGEFSKESPSSAVTFTFDELLEAIPKNLPQTTRQAPIEPNADFFSKDCDFEPPFMFVCTDITTSSEGHLLYNLKYGMDQTFVSRLTVPPVSVVRVERRQNGCGKQLSKQPSEPEVFIKLEPLDSEEEYEGSMYGYSENGYNSPMKAENVSSLNLYLTNDVSGVESWVFPLVFTSTGLTSPSSNYKGEAPLLYSLKYGPDGMYATSLSTPSILAVQIPSTRQATLNIKDDNSNTEVTLDSDVQVEHIKTEVQDFLLLDSPDATNDLKVIPDATSEESFPMILDVSSCKKRKRQLLPKIDTQNGCTSPEPLSMNAPKTLTTKLVDQTEDEDYQFLMSLLPDLKQMPQEQKSQVKKQIKDLVLTSRLCSGRIAFRNSRNNIYRDCGVLPSLRDWKF